MLLSIFLVQCYHRLLNAFYVVGHYKQFYKDHPYNSVFMNIIMPLGYIPTSVIAMLKVVLFFKYGES